jgi:hypothetical protein
MTLAGGGGGRFDIMIMVRGAGKGCGGVLGIAGLGCESRGASGIHSVLLNEIGVG